jgi:hypothetical protein
MNRSKFSRRGRRWKTKRQRAWRRGLLRMCRAFFDADRHSFEHLCSLWPSNSYGMPMPEITIEQALAAAEKLREITERELARIPGFVRGSVDVKRSGPRAFSVQSKWCNPGMPEAVTWPVHGPEDFEIKKLVGVPPGVSVVTLREPYPVVHELVMVPPKHAGTQTWDGAKAQDIIEDIGAQVERELAKLHARDPGPLDRCIACGSIHADHDAPEFLCPNGRGKFVRSDVVLLPTGDIEIALPESSGISEQQLEDIRKEIADSIFRTLASEDIPPQASGEQIAKVWRDVWTETGLANRRAAIEAAGGTVQEWTLALPPELEAERDRAEADAAREPVESGVRECPSCRTRSFFADLNAFTCDRCLDGV